MRQSGLILLLCSTICWAQPEPLFPVDEPVQPIIDGGFVPDLPDLPAPDTPLIRCRRQMCDMICAYGLALGEDGCPICECRTPDDLCKELGTCPEGTRCEVPTCFGELCASVKAECIPVCPIVKCVPCPGNKYLKDERGCQTCQCETICPMPMCSEPCEFGYANDERGCMTCKCNTKPPADIAVDGGWMEEEGAYDEGEDSESSEVSVEEVDCPRMMCRMFCEYGFMKDENGCQVCKCRSQPEHCSNMMCLMLCEHGFEKDERGCDVCKCRQQPQACPKRMCHVLVTCSNGFLKDHHGCNTCHCKQADDIVCEKFECKPGMTCKPMVPPDCLMKFCKPEPVCQPPSLCELHQGHPLTDDEGRMMMPHLKTDEQKMLFRGPVNCRPDGKFEPRQCIGEQCFCIDDRRVMQTKSLEVANPICAVNMTKEMRLSFELMHDLDDNDLDGATRDIEELVKAMLGDWMSVKKDSVVFVQVAYVKPGVLVVLSTILSDGTTDLSSASHHLHKQMYAGNCDVKYKHHVLTPDPDTVNFDHHYEDSNDPQDFFSDESSYDVHYNMAIIGTSIFILVVLIAIIIIVVLKRRGRSTSYQFRHKRMEKMDNFKKNLILGSELDKPDLLSKDSVQVTLADPEKPPL